MEKKICSSFLVFYFSLALLCLFSFFDKDEF